MTPLEIIEKVEARLMDGTGQAYAPAYNGCMYLTDDGRKCAVGIFIPDGHPAQLFRAGVYSLISTYEKDGEFPLPDFFYVNENLLASLQAIHDTDINWSGKFFNGRGMAALTKIKKHFNSE